MLKTHPMNDLLPISVNLRIAKIKEQGDIKSNWEKYCNYLKEFNDRCLTEPSFTESMLFKTKEGQSAQAFNALAEAIAILSFSPGKIEFGGDAV